MDKPSVTPGLSDWMWPTEKAITKAIADAGEAMAGAVQRDRGQVFVPLAAGDEAGRQAAMHRLTQTRNALAGARRRPAVQQL